jgi:hypothetical protein
MWMDQTLVPLWQGTVLELSHMFFPRQKYSIRVSYIFIYQPSFDKLIFKNKIRKTTNTVITYISRNVAFHTEF